MNIYAGKEGSFTNETLSERVVTKLASTIKIADLTLSFDRFFYVYSSDGYNWVSCCWNICENKKKFSSFQKLLNHGEAEFEETQMKH